MDVKIILAHGWGFDRTLWRYVAPLLNEASCESVDFGYFCRPYMPQNQQTPYLIGVGHSLGFLWLLKQKQFQLDGIVNISSVPTFCSIDLGTSIISRRNIMNVRDHLSRAPKSLLKWFWRRCGLPRSMLDGLPNQVDDKSLAEGLHHIETWGLDDVIRDLDIPIMLLGSLSDEILPPDKLVGAFQHHSNISTNLTKNGGHVLPLLEPEWCAANINRFVASLLIQRKDG